MWCAGTPWRCVAPRWRWTMGDGMRDGELRCRDARPWRGAWPRPRREAASAAPASAVAAAPRWGRGADEAMGSKRHSHFEKNIDQCVCSFQALKSVKNETMGNYRPKMQSKPASIQVNSGHVGNAVHLRQPSTCHCPVVFSAKVI